MLFLSDILAKRKKRLDCSQKTIAFEEEKILFQVQQVEKKTLPKNKPVLIEKPSNLWQIITLLPRQTSKKYVTDLYPKKSMGLGLEGLYRLMQISPKQKLLKQELWRFATIAATAVFILNTFGAYFAGQTLKQKLEAKAFGAYNDVLIATESAKTTDFSGMFDGFLSANQALYEAEQILFQDLKLNSQSDLETPLQGATLIIKAGVHLTKAGQHLAKTVYNLKNLPVLFALQNELGEKKFNPNLRITDKIKIDSGYLNLALTEIQQAEKYLIEIKEEYLPKNFQIKFQILREQLVQAKKLIAVVQEYVPLVLDLLGDRYPQRYLILLQNNHEARATGGFIGSYVLMDLNDGKIEKFELKDVYETDGQFHEKLTPPPGLNKITEDWKMRDGNYSPDFPTSAKQIMWFLEQEKGPTVDTVIAINQRIVENLLSKIGAIGMKDLDLEINAENFSWIFSYLIEAKFSQTNTPKQFLIDFAPLLKKEAFQPKNISFLIETIQEAIAKKDLLVYSNKPKVNGLIKKIGIDGQLKAFDQSFDYLQVINTSIGGNKSDGFINQKIEHFSKIDTQGKIMNDLTVIRKHKWYHKEDAIFDDLFRRFGSGKLERQELKDILGFGGNKNLMRVYVPLGSQLLMATGSVSTEEVTIYEDLGKTVFAFEQPPVYTERESKINLVYSLPHQLDLKYADNYRLMVQNQPGQEENYLTKKIELATNQKVLDVFPQNLLQTDNPSVIYNNFLDEDQYVSVVLGEK